MISCSELQTLWLLLQGSADGEGILFTAYLSHVVSLLELISGDLCQLDSEASRVPLSEEVDKLSTRCTSVHDMCCTSVPDMCCTSVRDICAVLQCVTYVLYFSARRAVLQCCTSVLDMCCTSVRDMSVLQCTTCAVLQCVTCAVLQCMTCAVLQCVTCAILQCVTYVLYFSARHVLYALSVKAAFVLATYPPTNFYWASNCACLI